MKKIIWIIMISILCQVSALATPKATQITYFEKYLVGEITRNEKKLTSDGREYTLYSMENVLYIPLKTLKGLGAKIQENEHEVKVILEAIEDQEAFIEQEIKEDKAYINNQPIYIDNLKTYSLLVGEEILIPLEALKIFGELNEFMGQYRISSKYYNLNQYIDIGEKEITNQSPYFVRFRYKDIFWDGKEYIETLSDSIELEAGETYKRELKVESEKKEVIHLTSILIEIHELRQEIDENNPYGQKNTDVFKAYQDQVRLNELENVFPPYIVTGTMKYPVGKFKAKEIVEIWRGEKKQYYIVKDSSDNKMFIPWESVDIVADLGVKWEQATREQIEDYVNLKGIESETDYFVWTDLYRQRTYILKGSKGEWKLEKVMKCSSGRNTYLTPRGEFKLEYRIPYFGMGKGYRCKNAVVIFRDYMYHSILFDKTGHYVKSGKYQLGQRVSHGCIRLSEEDSKWFYDHITLGTKVWIN